MKTYTFTLVLSGFSELREDMEDRLFESGCDDALLSFRDGVPYLDFDREAETLREAILSAIINVEGAGIGACVIRVEPDELVTASEIAERTGRSRESIRLLAAGKRGQGGFPPPLRGMKSRTRLWHWGEVALWLAQRECDLAAPLVEEAHAIAAINGALELRRHAPDSSSYLIKRIAG
jgi:predicted DNA-binding transcriptional regulator AlpA